MSSNLGQVELGVHGSSVLSHRTVLGKLPGVYNKVFKSLMGVPREFSVSALFGNLNVCNVAIRRCKQVYTF